MSSLSTNELPERALAALRRQGNPFRQQFARNPDDPVCSLYHVDALFADVRLILCSLIESYRGAPQRPTCVLPVLGARGAGKTHLLHWLKHGPAEQPHLFVTPGTFRIDAPNHDATFLEYVLYQLINVLLSAEQQRGVRPLEFVGAQLTRQVLLETLDSIGDRQGRDLTKTQSGWVARLGAWLGGRSSRRRSANALIDALRVSGEPSRQLVERAGWDCERLRAEVVGLLEQRETRDLTSTYRKRILAGLLRAALVDDETELADFLTDGFADPPGHVRPTRGQLTLAMLRALAAVLVGAGITVTIAFDQLEELLYGQTDDEIRRSCDAFFGGIVHLMSQVPGLCVLLFVEEGLWNRIVPPLPSHILDRIHEPIHVPGSGTVRHVRLHTPTVEELTAVVRRRVHQTLADFPRVEELPASFPFGIEFLRRLVNRETVLRLMLQGCCNRLDEIFMTPDAPGLSDSTAPVESDDQPAPPAQNDSSDSQLPAPIADADAGRTWSDMVDRWFHEVRTAERKLRPVGSLAAATGELHGGLARWLKLCARLGVEQDHWRMAAVQETVHVGDHPSYGTLAVIQWCHRDGSEKRAAVGLWLGRGVGKPRDLETKLVILNAPHHVDSLILLRPDDDTRLSGKSLVAWKQATTEPGKVRVEPISLDELSRLYAFPRWMQQAHDSYADSAVPDSVYRFLAEQTESIMVKLSLPPNDACGAAA
jgi:hypothetical protein